MATTFNVISLGTLPDLDTSEGNSTAENAGALVGMTIGGTSAPLYNNVKTFSPGSTGYGGGSSIAYDSDQADNNDTFRINGGPDQAFDSIVGYNATITYLDGTTANVTALVFQDSTGKTYLAPESFSNADHMAYEAKPIASITFNSVFANTADLNANRASTDFATPDGVVEGASGDDTINASYTKDQDGDVVGSGDGSINDVIIGGGGNDFISAGNGADTVYGDSGNLGTVGTADEYLNWSAQGPADTNLTGGFTQNTGQMDVTVSFGNLGNAGNSVHSGFDVFDSPVYTASGEPFNPTSGAQLSGGGGTGQTSLTRIDFDAAAGVPVSGEVSDVSFRISDIDVADWRDKVTVNAYDAQGNPVAVTITSTSDTVSGNSVTAAGGADNYGDQAGSALFEIAGPVARIEIIYEQLGTVDQFISVTDVHFTTIPVVPGNDTIDGGTGNDLLYGEGGDDSILGGSGHDTIDGGTGDDVITGGLGNDRLTGGDGDDTFTYAPGDGADTITDFNAGATGTLDDGDSTNNDFIDLSGYYDHISELYADQADDGILNQSNTTNTRGEAVDYSDNSQFGSGSLTFQNASADSSSFTAENTAVVCFTTGTAIRTPTGDKLIDDLRPGDLVCTVDNGPQPIRWIGRRTIGQEALIKTPSLRPVLIQAGIMGVARDMLVSQQHGMLLRDRVLVRAKTLAETGGNPVRIANGKRSVTYVHLLFDRHEVIFAEGAPSESLYPGKMAVGAMSAVAQAELETLFPALKDADANLPDAWYGATAREYLRHGVALAEPERATL